MKKAAALEAQHKGESVGGDQDAGHRGVQQAGAGEGISIRVTAVAGCSSTVPSHVDGELNSAAVSSGPAGSREGGIEQLSQSSQGISSQGPFSQSSSSVASSGMQTNERIRDEAQASSTSQPSTDGVSSPAVGGEEGAGLTCVERREREGEQASASTDSNREGSLGQQTGRTLQESSSSRLLRFSLEGGEGSNEGEDKGVPSSVSAQPSSTTTSPVTGPSTSASSDRSSSSVSSSSSSGTARASTSSSQSSPPPPGSVFSSTLSSDSSTAGPSVLSSLRSASGVSSSGGEPWALVQGVSPSFRSPLSSSAFSEVDRPSYLPVNSSEETDIPAPSLSSVRQQESSSSSQTEGASVTSSTSSSLPSPVVASSSSSSSGSHFREPSTSQSSSTASPSVSSYGIPGLSSLSPPEGRRPPSASTAAAASVLAAAAMEAAAAAGRPQRDESATEQVQDFEDEDEFEEGEFL